MFEESSLLPSMHYRPDINGTSGASSRPQPSKDPIADIHKRFHAAAISQDIPHEVALDKEAQMILLHSFIVRWMLRDIEPRKDGSPGYTHSHAVSDAMGPDRLRRIAGLYHDVPEDTDIKIEDWRDNEGRLKPGLRSFFQSLADVTPELMDILPDLQLLKREKGTSRLKNAEQVRASGRPIAISLREVDADHNIKSDIANGWNSMDVEKQHKFMIRWIMRDYMIDSDEGRAPFVTPAEFVERHYAGAENMDYLRDLVVNEHHTAMAPQPFMTIFLLPQPVQQTPLVLRELAS